MTSGSLKSSPVGLSAPWVAQATIPIAASVCGSAVCPTVVWPCRLLLSFIDCRFSERT
jgi:hypothetical protein